MTMDIGVKLPHTGHAAMTQGVTALAQALERAGFDSLWVSDHIVFPKVIESAYPFAPDGRATWPTDIPYAEALTTLAAAAAVTERVRLGTAALVLPLRNPVLLAKQAATVNAISGGRLELGLGAGWLREEFDAMNMSFETRGARMVEWMALLRECWTGQTSARASDHYDLPADTVVLPKPDHGIPLYVGGHSPVALRRAGRLGDGWLAQQSASAMDPRRLATEISCVREAATAADRDPAGIRVVLRLVDSAGRCDAVATRLAEYAATGVAEVIVDTDVASGDPRADCELLRHAVASA